MPLLTISHTNLMSKFYIAYTVSLALLILSACKENYSNKKPKKFTLDDFPKHIEVTRHNLLPSDSLVFPLQCKIIDQHLFVIDQRSKRHVHVYSLDSVRYLGSFGGHGEGAGEALQPTLVCDDSQGFFYLYDITNRKVLGWNPDSLIARKKPQREFQFNERGIATSIGFANASMYMTDITRTVGRLFEFDTATLTMGTLGNLPALKTAGAATTLSQANQAQLSCANDRIVVASYLAPFFEIYRPSTKTWSAFSGPIDEEPKFKERVMEGAKVFIIDDDETAAHFINVATTNKYIYLLYSGQLIAENSHPSGNQLMVFDFDGTPVKRYVFDKPIVAFSVYRDAVVYGINVDLKPEIVSFNLD